MAAYALIIMGESSEAGKVKEGLEWLHPVTALVSSLVSERKPRAVAKEAAGINIHNFYCCVEKYFITAVWYVSEIFLQLLELPISSCLPQNCLSVDNRSRELTTSKLCLKWESALTAFRAGLLTAAVHL